MSKRHDICVPRKKKDGGTFWHKCGTAFEDEKGIALYFDSLPLPDSDGRCVARLFEPGPKPSRQHGGQAAADPDDSIPF